MVARESDPRSKLHLPPGFRFYPTDEELLVQYLCRKVSGHHFSLQIIGEIDLYKFNPWDLPDKALFGEKEWYFFSPRDRKYPNGSRPNRVAGSGYWKATGTDKVVTMEGRKVGIKKALVFYTGKAPKGVKTNWIMHEYRLSDLARKHGSARLDDWVLCRIYEKNSAARKQETVSDFETALASPCKYDDGADSLPQMGGNGPPDSFKNFYMEEEKLQMNHLNHRFGFGSGSGSSYLDESSMGALVSEMAAEHQGGVGISGFPDDAWCDQRLGGLPHGYAGSYDALWGQYY